MASSVITESELQVQIDRQSTWYYEFNLRGRKTPVKDRTSIIRHEQRKDYFFKELVKLNGGTLAGKRLLDMGCNEGYFLLGAASNGCDSLYGIDQSQQNIDRANLVFEANEIDSRHYQFQRGDFLVAPLEEHGPFDIVLALGVLHWMDLTSQVKLLERMASLKPRFMVIDTVVSPGPNSTLTLTWSNKLGPLAPPPYRLVSLPTRQGLLDMMRDHGYHGGALKPCFADYTSSEDYVAGVRRAFLFSREPIPESSLAAMEQIDPEGDIADLLQVSWKRLVSAVAAKGLRRIGLKKNN